MKKFFKSAFAVIAAVSFFAIGSSFITSSADAATVSQSQFNSDVNSAVTNTNNNPYATYADKAQANGLSGLGQVAYYGNVNSIYNLSQESYNNSATPFGYVAEFTQPSYDSDQANLQGNQEVFGLLKNYYYQFASRLTPGDQATINNDINNCNATYNNGVDYNDDDDDYHTLSGNVSNLETDLENGISNYGRTVTAITPDPAPAPQPQPQQPQQPKRGHHKKHHKRRGKRHGKRRGRHGKRHASKRHGKKGRR